MKLLCKYNTESYTINKKYIKPYIRRMIYSFIFKFIFNLDILKHNIEDLGDIIIT